MATLTPKRNKKFELKFDSPQELQQLEAIARELGETVGDILIKGWSRIKQEFAKQAYEVSMSRLQQEQQERLGYVPESVPAPTTTPQRTTPSIPDKVRFTPPEKYDEGTEAKLQDQMTKSPNSSYTAPVDEAHLYAEDVSKIMVEEEPEDKEIVYQGETYSEAEFIDGYEATEDHAPMIVQQLRRHGITIEQSTSLKLLRNRCLGICQEFEDFKKRLAQAIELFREYTGKTSDTDDMSIMQIVLYFQSQIVSRNNKLIPNNQDESHLYRDKTELLASVPPEKAEEVETEINKNELVDTLNQEDLLEKLKSVKYQTALPSVNAQVHYIYELYEQSIYGSVSEHSQKTLDLVEAECPRFWDWMIDFHETGLYDPDAF